MLAKDKYEILISIKEQLAGMDKTLRSLKEAREEANSFQRELRQGFAIGIGNEVVRQISMMPRRIKAMTDSLVDARLEMEAIRGRLEYVAGDKAGMLWDKAKEKADRYGQSVIVVGRAFGQMLAGAKKSNLTFEETERIFDSLLAASTVLSLSSEETDSALRAIIQIIGKAKVSAEELRQQLGERLAGAFNLAAESMGLTNAELDKMLERGSLTESEFLPRFADTLNQTFDPHVAKRAAELRGQLHRLNNAWFEIKLTLGDSGVIDSYTKSLQRMLEITKSPDFQDGLKYIGEGMGWVAEKTASAVKEMKGLVDSLKAIQLFMNFAEGIMSDDNANVKQTNFGAKLVPDFRKALFEAFVQTYVLVDKGSGPSQKDDFSGLSDFGRPGDEPPGLKDIVGSINERNLTTNGIMLADAVSRRELLQLDPMRTLVSKQQELVDLIREELDLRKEQNRIRQEILDDKDDELSDDARLKMLEEMQKEGLDIAQLEATLMRLGDFSTGFKTSLVDWVNSFGTAAEQVSGIVTGTLQTAIDEVANSIDGLIFGTMTWGEAFSQVGRQILRTIINLVVQFVAQQVVMLAMRAAFGSSMIGMAAGEAAILSAIYAIPATLSTIASAGAAALAAPAQIAAALGITQGIAGGMNQAGGLIPGFADGGLVRGPGGPRSDAIMARLSNMEYVMPAAQTARYLPMLEAMRSGSPTISELAQRGGSSFGSGTEIIVVGTMAEAMAAAADRSGLVTIREMNAMTRKRV